MTAVSLFVTLLFQLNVVFGVYSFTFSLGEQFTLSVINKTAFNITGRGIYSLPTTRDLEFCAPVGSTILSAFQSQGVYILENSFAFQNNCSNVWYSTLNGAGVGYTRDFIVVQPNTISIDVSGTYSLPCTTPWRTFGVANLPLSLSNPYLIATALGYSSTYGVTQDTFEAYVCTGSVNALSIYVTFPTTYVSVTATIPNITLTGGSFTFYNITVPSNTLAYFQYLTNHPIDYYVNGVIQEDSTLSSTNVIGIQLSSNNITIPVSNASLPLTTTSHDGGVIPNPPKTSSTTSSTSLAENAATSSNAAVSSKGFNCTLLSLLLVFLLTFGRQL